MFKYVQISLNQCLLQVLDYCFQEVFFHQAERDSWTAALKSASHRHMRSHLEELRSRLRAKMDSNPNMSSEAPEDAEVLFPPVIGKKS